LVLAPLKENVINVIARLKRRSSLRVHEAWQESRPARMAGLYRRPILGRHVSTPRSLWTDGKFIVYVFSEQHLMKVIEYVRDHNRHSGLSPDPFEWIEPLYPPPIHAGDRCYRDTAAEPRL
jgi:hypothetical protein